MKRFTSMLVFLVLVGSSLFAQDIQITGKVTNADDGSPLPGVTVVSKSVTSTGTITDVDGNYEITAPSDAVLVFSFIGMETQEIPVGGMTEINIPLSASSTQMEEVVVTAFGRTKEQKTLGYSVTQFVTEDVTQASSENALGAMSGKVAGLNISSASGSPGASSRITLRGYSSLRNDANQPLIVIDGVPSNNSAVTEESLNGGYDFGNRFNDINPDDIESISVLKGSSASALYGSRAANGVILITTKSGKRGGDIKVEYKGSYMMETPLMLPTYQNDYGQGFYGEPDLLENTSWGPQFDGKEHLWGRVVDNSQQVKVYEAQPSNVKDFFDIGTTAKHTFTVSKGGENTSFLMSYGNVMSDGIFPTEADLYNRHNIRFRGTANHKRIEASIGMQYIKKEGNFVITGQEQSVYDNVMQVPRDMSIVDGKDYNDPFWNLDGYYSGYTLNPYYTLNEHGTTADEDRVLGDVSLNFNITDYLRIRSVTGFDIASTGTKFWRAITEVGPNDYNDHAGQVSESKYNESQLNTDLFVEFNKEFDKFTLGSYIGTNINQREYYALGASVIGLDIPYYYNLSNSSATPTTGTAESKRRLVGALGSVDLGYDDMVFLNLSLRNDWSSTLPEKNNSFMYYSVSSSFVFTELLPSNSILNFGKVRASIAQVGNDADPYTIYSSYYQGTHTDGYRSLTYPLPGGINGFEVSNSIGNLELQPEITTEFEVGTFLEFMDNKFNIDFAYYDKTTTDLIWPVDIVGSSGYTKQLLNLGEITNKGIEAAVTVTPIRTPDFRWSITATFTKNNNKLVKLDDEGTLENVSLGGTSSLNFIAVPGEPIGLYYGEVPSYDPNGNMIVSESTGLPVAADEYDIVGSSQYDWMGGLSSGLSYKGFAFNFTLDTKQGGLMYSRTAEMQYFSGTAPNTLYNDRQPFIIPNSVNYDATTDTYTENFTPIQYSENLHTYWGQSYGGGQFNRRFMVDRTFVKLREVIVSYTLPKQLTEKAFIKRATVSLIGRNLFIWTAEDNTFVDPEATTFGNGIEGDFGEYSATPATRKFGMSLNLTF